jgi:hypothetical protein
MATNSRELTAAHLHEALPNDVCRDKRRWRAQITVHGRKRYLGNFGTISEAAAVYTRAAQQQFGEFARLS